MVYDSKIKDLLDVFWKKLEVNLHFFFMLPLEKLRKSHTFYNQTVNGCVVSTLEGMSNEGNSIISLNLHFK